MHDCIIKNNIATLQHLNVHKQLYLTTYYIKQIHITKNKANSSLKVYYETRKDHKNVYIINKIQHMLESHIKDVSSKMDGPEVLVHCF